MEIKNILAVRNDRFGEFLLNVPAFRALKETYPKARLTLVTDTYVRELAECIDCVDEVITRENRRHSFCEILRFSRVLRKRKFDLSVILNPTKEFNIAVFLAGIPKRAGYARKWDFLLTDTIEDKRYQALKHEVEYNLDLVSVTGARTADKSISISMDGGKDEDFCREFDINGDDLFIAIHPFTSDPVKQWPLERFRELAAALFRETQAKVIIVGGKDKLKESAELFKGQEDKIINATGKTDLIQLASLLKRCGVLISGDSGPMHLAAAVGTPVVALFRSDIKPKSSVRWGPWGEGHVVTEKDNLDDIKADEVTAAAKTIFFRSAE